LQDQTFYERKGARDKKLDELAEETVRVLEWGQKILKEKDSGKLEELIREGEELLGKSSIVG